MSTTKRVKAEPLTDAEIDTLLENLTSDEIEKLLEDVDPDDTHMPPSARCTYSCQKAPTGPFNKKKLLNYIYDQAKNTPDKVDYVPHVPGTVLGTKWVPPQQETLADQEFELDFELGDEIEMALGDASMSDMIDLAGIMGLHSMINQEQYHHAVGAKTFGKEVDADLGWDGITKATPLKCYAAEPPNLTDPVEVLEKIKSCDEEQKEVNLNNVEVSEKQFLEIFEALKGNTVLNNLSLSNTSLTDWAAANLCHTLENNDAIETINLESNCIMPQTLSKLFESLNATESIKEFKAMNQAAQVLGNRVEMAITKSIENNKTLLKVGMQFEFNDCQNRVAVHLQKNLDRIRIKRIAAKLAERENSGYFMYPSVQPGGTIPQQDKEWTKAGSPESEYEYYYSDEE
eukprot:GFUD01005579.1.p1 GENE.GFUD01005579.1~~GFUD01005579.1.p1  ORF type:complete len:401 (-),score=131.72 GFUD01005579.1:246-1448(-)